MSDNSRVIQTQSAGNKQTKTLQKLPHPQLCSAAPGSVRLQSLSGPAGGMEDQMRQQKAISYPLGLQAEEWLTTSPADPQGLKSQGNPLTVFSNNFSSLGQDEKPPSPQ